MVGAVLLTVQTIAGLVVFGLVAARRPANPTAGAIVVGAAVALIFLVPFLVISGVVGTFFSSYWTRSLTCD